MNENIKVVQRNDKNELELFTPFVMVEDIMDKVPEWYLTPESSGADIAMKNACVSSIFSDKIHFFIYNALFMYVDDVYELCKDYLPNNDKYRIIERLERVCFELYNIMNYNDPMFEPRNTIHGKLNLHSCDISITETNYKDYILMSVSRIYNLVYSDISEILGYPIMLNAEYSKYLLVATSGLRDRIDTVILNALRTKDKYIEAMQIDKTDMMIDEF